MDTTTAKLTGEAAISAARRAVEVLEAEAAELAARYDALMGSADPGQATALSGIRSARAACDEALATARERVLLTMDAELPAVRRARLEAVQALEPALAEANAEWNTARDRLETIEADLDRQRREAISRLHRASDAIEALTRRALAASLKGAREVVIERIDVASEWAPPREVLISGATWRTVVRVLREHVREGRAAIRVDETTGAVTWMLAGGSAWEPDGHGGFKRKPSRGWRAGDSAAPTQAIETNPDLHRAARTRSTVDRV